MRSGGVISIICVISNGWDANCSRRRRHRSTANRLVRDEITRRERAVPVVLRSDVDIEQAGKVLAVRASEAVADAYYGGS